MGRKTRGAPKDELAETREAPTALPRMSLLAAGEAVIRQKGFEHASVEDIAARAGVSTDVFHAHFGSKGALLRALCDHWIDQMITLTTDATRSGIWATSSAAEVVDVAARSAIDAIYDQAPILRGVLAHAATEPSLRTSLRRIGTLLTRRVTKVIKESRRAEDAHIQERHVAFCLLTAIALAHHAILVGSESSGVPFDKDELASEASRAINAYLGAVGAQRVIPTAPPSTHARTGNASARGNIRSPSRV